MKLTRQFFLNNRTKNGGFTKKQLEVLGLEWPPKKGWQKAFIGKEIPNDIVTNFSIAKNTYM